MKLAGDQTALLANAPITDIWYSDAESPVGFPDMFNYTPTVTGFSGTPTVTSPKYKIVGKTICVSIMGLDGTSNGTGMSFTGPVPISESVSNPTVLSMCGVRDNGALSATPGHIGTSANSNVFQAYKAFYQTLWTASGQKSVWMPAFWYEYQ